MVGIGIESVGAGQKFSFGVDYYVEGLGVGSELVSLQKAPFVTDGTDLDIRTVFIQGDCLA